MKKPEVDIVQKIRRTPRGKEHILYAYVREENFSFAKTIGKKNFGSISNFVDYLITREIEQAKIT